MKYVFMGKEVMTGIQFITCLYGLENLLSIKSTRKTRSKKISKTKIIFFKYILIKYEKSTFGNKLL